MSERKDQPTQFPSVSFGDVTSLPVGDEPVVIALDPALKAKLGVAGVINTEIAAEARDTTLATPPTFDRLARD